MINKCQQCGIEFDSPNGRNCCSRSCYRKSRRETLRRHDTHPAICRVCGKEFETKERDRFCSKSCRAAYYKTRATGDLDAALKELSAYNETHGTCISYGRWMRGVRV